MIKSHFTASLWLTLALSALLVLLGLFPAVTEPLLQFDRDQIRDGAWWRLLSGQLVHYGYYHLAMNVAALLLCGVVLLRQLTLWTYLLILLISAAAVGLGLYFFTADLSFYAGLSGILHGLILAGLMMGLREVPLFNGLVIIVFLGKLIHEQMPGFDTSHALLPVPVAVDAHAYGAMGGVLAVIILVAIKFMRTGEVKPSISS